MNPPANLGRRRAWRALRITATLALIGFVIHQAGLLNEQGRREFVATITDVDVFYLCLSLLVSLAMNFVSSYKWHILLVSRNIHAGFWRLFALYYVGKFFNLFLPTGVGGDVARVYELGRVTGANAESLASVFVERFTGVVTLTVVSLVAVAVSLHRYDTPLITISLVLFVLATATVIWMILDPRPLAWFSRTVTRRIPALGGIAVKIHRTHDIIRAYKDNTGTLWYALAISLVFYFLAVVNVWVSLLAFSPDVDFLTVLIAVPAILLIMNLPISIGGIGLMEAAYTIIFTAFGYSSSLALSAALLIRMKTIIDGVIGGLFHLFRGDRPTPSTRTEY